QNMAEWFWRERPTIVETEHYSSSLRKNAWNSDTVAQSIEEYHATWVSIHHWPDEFLAKERPLVEKLANRMGYWLFVNEAVVPRVLAPGQSFYISVQWENRGVAPMYRSWAVALALKEASGRVVWSAGNTAYDTRRWMPGETTQTFLSYRLPDALPPGRYHLCLGLTPPEDPSRPSVKLAMQGRDADGWHRLAPVEVR
ncbi:MAG: DUF4832 domain-containing protein, partial [Armatimonadota bacterium]|nr:DUF4832 domain-containing protein [Armatimonadota bacterium]